MDLSFEDQRELGRPLEELLERELAARPLLTSGVRATVLDLLGRARDGGELAASVDLDQAANLFLILVSGQIFLWQEDQTTPEPRAAATRLGVFFRAALRGRESAGELTPLLAFDVRPMLAEGRDPLEEILGSLARIAPGGMLLLSAPFRPEPLLTLLAGRKCQTECTEVGQDHFLVEIVPGDRSRIHDYRALPAPEPLEQVLLRSQELVPGAFLLARLPRPPRLLLPRLGERGLGTWLEELPDGTAILAVRAARAGRA